MASPALILSYGLGTGHARVAAILSEKLRALGHDVSHRPLEEWVPLDYDLLFRYGYLFLALRTPKIWDLMYTSSIFAGRESLAHWPMRKRAALKFGEKILGGAGLVVATQYNAMEIVADWKKYTGGTVKLAAVITDYDVYPLWARPEVDLFIVPHEGLKPLLVERGIEQGRVAVAGLPISPSFEKGAASGTMARALLGLPEGRRLALVVGGGAGVGRLEECVRALLGTRGWSVILVCGNNEKLRRRLKGLAQHEPGRLRVLGYREDMAALVAASDVIVTKGGGLSLTEALVAGKRVVVVPGFPGQDKANIAYMADRGWITVCEDPRELPTILPKPAEKGYSSPDLPRAPADTAAQLLHELAGG